MLSCILTHLLERTILVIIHCFYHISCVWTLVSCKIPHLLFGWSNYIHLRSSWGMSNHDKSSRHHFNNAYSKMFFFHRMYRNFTSFKQIIDIASGFIYVKFDWICNFKLFCRLFQLLNNHFVILASCGSYQVKLCS